MNIFETKEISCQRLHSEIFERASVELYMARFDLLHPVISGNKVYKLHFFLEQAVKENKSVVTFGGPYSNHLSAAAFACRKLNIPITGIVNGEGHPLTDTLKQCIADGMHLKYISRQAYREMKTTADEQAFPGTIIIPEGGYHILGAKGAARMAEKIANLTVTHICLPVGTATTLAGFLKARPSKIIAVPVIKNMIDIPYRLRYLETTWEDDQLDVWDGYSFGGFAKMTPVLQSFMENFKKLHGIELDRVYTAKMMWGMMEKISMGYFPEGSKIVCVHTGGIQGNRH